jgi:hypothetical protein
MNIPSLECYHVVGKIARQDLFTNIIVVTPILNKCQHNNYFFRSLLNQPLNYFIFDLGCQGRLTSKSLGDKQL